jgi:hypothetical protein
LTAIYDLVQKERKTIFFTNLPFKRDVIYGHPSDQKRNVPQEDVLHSCDRESEVEKIKSGFVLVQVFKESWEAFDLRCWQIED